MLPLAEMAHTLGGCAGMFGFSRLANASKRFEYAVQSNAPETLMRAAELISAVEEALIEITAHLATLDTEANSAEKEHSSPEPTKRRQAGAASALLIRAR
jgi:HPt (histidine-containing phosphotransfer) domain-containing protein